MEQPRAAGDARTRVHGWAVGAPSTFPAAGTVASVMSHPVITLDAAASLEQAMGRMREAEVHHLLLTDRGRVVALVSDRNLIRALGFGPTSRDAEQRYRRHPVFQVASYHLATVEEATTVGGAAALMLEAGISALPVVRPAEHNGNDDGNGSPGTIVGIVTSRDLLRYLAGGGRGSVEESLRRAS